MSSEPEGHGSMELKDRFRRLRVIYRTTVALSQADHVDEICDKALHGLQEALAGSRAGLLIWEEDAGFQLYAWKGKRERWTPIIEGVGGLITQENADSLFIADVNANDQVSPYRRAILDQQVQSFAFIPLHYQQQLLGGVLLRYDEAHPFSDEEITVTGALAGHMALALARKRDEQLLQAAHDKLEGRVERRTAQLKGEIVQREKAEERLREESARVRLLQEIAAFANEADSFEDALHFTLDKVCEFSKWPLGHAYLLRGANSKRPMADHLWYCEDVELYDSFRQERETLSSDPVQDWLGYVTDSDKPDWLSRVAERGFSRINPPHESGVASSFAFPVVVNSNVVAVVEFFATQPIEAESSLLDAVQFVATQLARVVEREQAANALRESEAMLAEAQRLAHIGSWEWDIEADHISWSDQLYRIYGLEPGDLHPTYENYLELIHPLDRAEMDQAIQRAYGNREPFEQHHRIIRSDGFVRIVHARGNPVLNENGDVVRMHGTGQDVTEQRQTEEALRKSEESYRTLARNIPDAIVALYDTDLRLILVEGDAPPLVRPGMDLKALFALEQQDLKLSPFTKALQGQPQIFERERGERVYLMRAVPIRDEDGEIFAAIAMAQDITERKHAERQSERRAQQFAALHEVAQTVASSLDLNVILERVLDTLRPLLDAEGVFILLCEGDDELVFAAANEVGVGNLAGQRVPASRGVASEVLRTGEIQWIYGDETANRVYHELEEVAHYHPRAIVAAPLKLHGKLIGVIEAVHTNSDAFGAEHIQIIETAANWTAIAIGNARLFQAQQEARHTAETLRAANTTLSQTLELQTILDTLLNYASELIGFERALIFLLHRDGRLRVRSHRGFAHPQLNSPTYNVSDIPEFEHLLNEKKSIVIEETSSNENGASRRPNWRPGPGEMALAVPLLSGERVVGVLTMYGRARQYTERHATLAEALAAQASVAVQNARLFAQVQTGQERLRHLSKQIVSAQEEERQRVSRELHDEAGQALTALKISLEMIRINWQEMPHSVVNQLDEAIRMTDQTMEQIRLLAHDLRPPVLDTFGLGASIEGIVRDFGRRTDLEIEFKSAQLSDLPQAATISFYRFVQEALTNIARHADATRVQVELRDDDDKIMVAVRDNGNGFHVEEKVNMEEPRGGIGLTGMQDRFDLLNGWVEIESAPGQGTRVAAYVPRQEER